MKKLLNGLSSWGQWWSLVSLTGLIIFCSIIFISRSEGQSIFIGEQWIDLSSLEASFEGVLDLSDLQGQISDSQIANSAVDGGTGGEIQDATITAADLGTDSVSSDELNATGVESELEAVLDAADIQGYVTTVSGTYLPTLTNVTNVAASTAYAAQYLRVGNVVTVSGKVDIDATLAASTATELGVSLPVSSNFGAEEDCGGNAISDSVASLSARIKADSTNDRASVVFKAISLTNDSYSFEFTYEKL